VSIYIEASLRRVSLERGGRTVLSAIDWRVRPGERWVLAGANGAGKTQLLKLLAGSVWPTPGICGAERLYLWRAERYRTPQGLLEEIAYLGPERQDKYERYGWNATAAAVVGTGIHRTDIPLDTLTAAEHARSASLLARLGIGALAGRRFLSLSYGERRLVLLARALASRPKLLLLDELLSGLDATHRAHALAWLERTRRGSLPWVLSAHRLKDVPASATHALVLERGRILYRGRIDRAALASRLERRRRRASRTAPPPAGAALVRLTRASVYLDGRRVLEGLTFAVHSGECWVIHGPNGSGKSTLLRTIYGDHAVAARGRIERAGIAPGVPLGEFRRRVGLVAPHLQSSFAASASADPAARRITGTGVPQFTVREVVESGRQASLGLDAAPSLADRRAGREAMQRFGLAALAQRALAELSYGQTRRVLFARAWASRPALLLLDEPYAGLDAPTRYALERQVESLAATGVAIVLATHHPEEWPAATTHELELAGGRPVYCGAVRARLSRRGVRA